MDLCYEALNGSCGKYVRPYGIHVLILITMMLTTIVTVIGNLLVIISIGHFKQLHTPTNQLILSLALCDFLLRLFVMPLSAVRSMQGCWYFGDFLLLLMISISWLIPAVFSYMSTYLELNLHGDRDFYKTHVRCVGGCHVFFSHGPAVVTSLFSFYVPGLIIIGIYSRIYMAARNQARSISLQLNQLRRVYPSEGTHCRAQKATITIAIVVGVFLVCWTPFFLCNIMNPFIGYTTPSNWGNI